MSRSERSVVVLILISVAIMVGIDLLTDGKEGVPWWHLLSEAGIGVIALAGIFYFVRDSFRIRHLLENSISENSKLKLEAEVWKLENKKFVEGLSQSIDAQLSKWQLSNAEKEVALLLLKGLSLKEIAEIRQTTEKTARVQSMAIYSKSGLNGRSELAAFFLEDLLQPSSISTGHTS